MVAASVMARGKAIRRPYLMRDLHSEADEERELEAKSNRRRVGALQQRRDHENGDVGEEIGAQLSRLARSALEP
jgi:hypothetical protein